MQSKIWRKNCKARLGEKYESFWTNLCTELKKYFNITSRIILFSLIMYRFWVSYFHFREIPNHRENWTTVRQGEARWSFWTRRNNKFLHARKNFWSIFDYRFKKDFQRSFQTPFPFLSFCTAAHSLSKSTYTIFFFFWKQNEWKKLRMKNFRRSTPPPQINIVHGSKQTGETVHIFFKMYYTVSVWPVKIMSFRTYIYV